MKKNKNKNLTIKSWYVLTRITKIVIHGSVDRINVNIQIDSFKYLILFRKTFKKFKWRYLILTFY